MTESYESKVEELMELQEQLIQPTTALLPQEELARQEKRAVEAESALRLKENHIRHLNL